MSADSYDPGALPPLDVRWHTEALQKIGKTHGRVRNDVNAAVESLTASLRSPLQVAPLECGAQHQDLLACVAAARQAAAASGEPELARQWAQTLVLAGQGSARHVAQVQELSAKLPDTMPRTEFGGVVWSQCREKAFAFRRCCDAAVDGWFAKLEELQTRGNQ